MAQCHHVARLDGRVGQANLVPGLDALGAMMAALAVGILDQRDVRRAVRIVLDRLDDTGNAVLVATEVDDAVLLLRATALVARRDAAGVVARTGLALRNGQRRVRLALCAGASGRP
jgi:hypothetical protein